MYADIGILFLFWLKNIIVFASAVAVLVIGILIAVNKVKSTKVLGISFIISAVASLTSSLQDILIRYVDIEKYAQYVSISSVVTLISSLVAALCISIFIHKSYGKKFIYIPVMLLPVSSIVANLIVRTALNSSSASMSAGAWGYWMTLTGEINNLVTGTVSAVIIITVLYKNRNTEKAVPKLWLFKTISFIVGCVLACFRIVSYSMMIAATVNGKSNISVLAQLWTGNLETIAFMTQLFGALAALIIPIYVLISVSDVSRKGKLESAHI